MLAWAASRSCRTRPTTGPVSATRSRARTGAPQGSAAEAQTRASAHASAGTDCQSRRRRPRSRMRGVRSPTRSPRARPSRAPQKPGGPRNESGDRHLVYFLSHESSDTADSGPRETRTRDRVSGDQRQAWQARAPATNPIPKRVSRRAHRGSTAPIAWLIPLRLGTHRCDATRLCASLTLVASSSGRCSNHHPERGLTRSRDLD